MKKEYFESNKFSANPSEQKQQPVSVSCCGRKPIAEDEETPSPTSPTNSSNDGMLDNRSSAVPEVGNAQPQIFQIESLNSVPTPMQESPPARGTQNGKQRALLHDPANNGVDANGFQHGCNCGPDCVCLGCAAHPQNSTTLQYVKELYDYQADTADDNMDSLTLPSPQGTNTFSFDQPLRNYHNQNDLNVLPPDLYFPYQLNLPGCNNGDCRCGTNCSCSGCLTHSGHNGIHTSLQSPLNFNTFRMDTSQPSQMNTPTATSSKWDNFCSVTSRQHSCCNQPVGFQPSMIPQPNMSPPVNHFGPQGNHRAPQQFAQNPLHRTQIGLMNPAGAQYGRPLQQPSRASTFPFAPASHSHPIQRQYGFATQSPSQSPIGTPTTAGPFQPGYGF